MTNTRDYIQPIIADDGSVHYPSVMTPSSDKTPAICPMVPDRIIPVIFVPGIMGSNLKNSGTNRAVWTLNSAVGAAWHWASQGAADRKQLLHPAKTDVDDDGALPDGTNLSKDELRRRGWGEVAAMSYGNFLVWLENALNDCDPSTDYGREGLRAELMKQVEVDAPGVQPLTYDEVALSYRYRMPVHAVGYNWLQSNVDSAHRLKQRIDAFMNYYRGFRYRCSKVILVTHSMGGLVARYYSECLGGSEDVLGIVHGVMPATGAATAYKRVKAGTEGAAGMVLGDDAAKMTAVFAQAPGALQLLPSTEYGMGWLKIKDHDRVVSLPKQEPYTEIYLQRGKWWGLIDDRLLNPLDPNKQTADQDWKKFKGLISDTVQPFHQAISHQYHCNTYAFYGDDVELKAWGDVTWKMSAPLNGPPINDLTSGKLGWDAGTGSPTVDYMDGRYDRGFTLQAADEPGDGTVPRRSGKAPAGQRGVQLCIPLKGFEHEAAYKDNSSTLIDFTKHPERRRLTLWAIIKIAYDIRNTAMADRKSVV